MELSVGALLEGKVKSITGFGAFVQLECGRTGLVHITEISNSYVKDIHDHLSEGQSVRVKVIGIDDAGRIRLSVKQAAEPHSRAPRQESPRGPLTFEEKLKQFMTDSDQRISGCRQYEHRTKSRKR